MSNHSAKSIQDIQQLDDVEVELRNPKFLMTQQHMQHRSNQQTNERILQFLKKSPYMKHKLAKNSGNQRNIELLSAENRNSLPYLDDSIFFKNRSQQKSKILPGD